MCGPPTSSQARSIPIRKQTTTRMQRVFRSPASRASFWRPIPASNWMTKTASRPTRKVRSRSLIRFAPGREEAEQGPDYEEQSHDRDYRGAVTGVEARDEAEEHHGECIREGRERCGGADTVNVGCFRAEDPLRGDRDRHEEEPDEGTGDAGASCEELVRGGSRHRYGYDISFIAGKSRLRVRCDGPQGSVRSAPERRDKLWWLWPTGVVFAWGALAAWLGICR